MKDSRAGETLWSQWDGKDHFPARSFAVVFYTEEHVDIYNEVVRRALSSAIQRDGVVDSLGQAFSLLDGETLSSHGYVGCVDGDPFHTVCDKDGMTIFGNLVEEVIPVTWVEIYV